MARFRSILSGPSFQGPLCIPNRGSLAPLRTSRKRADAPVTEAGPEGDGLEPARSRSPHNLANLENRGKPRAMNRAQVLAP